MIPAGELPAPFNPLTELPVPADLESRFGYPGAARYVAFWWERAGDELAWSDGWSSVVGGPWWMWHDYWYTTNPTCLIPAELGIGSSDQIATHFLMLDRTERILYLAPRSSVNSFMLENNSVPTTRPSWARSTSHG